MISNFIDLKVWQKAHQLVIETYKLVEKFPQDERFRLISQLTRAVVSVPANIAEGFGRYTKKEYINFLLIARGSLSEVEYYYILSKDLGYLDSNEFSKKKSEISEIGKMLNGLINSIRDGN